MQATSKVIKASAEDKKKAKELLNEVKDKPLLVKKLEAINLLLQDVTVQQDNA